MLKKTLNITIRTNKYSIFETSIDTDIQQFKNLTYGPIFFSFKHMKKADFLKLCYVQVYESLLRQHDLSV